MSERRKEGKRQRGKERGGRERGRDREGEGEMVGMVGRDTLLLSEGDVHVHVSSLI